jgi:hypothetical protein
MRDYAEQLEQRLITAARAEARRGRTGRLWRATLTRPVPSVAVLGSMIGAAATVAALLLTAAAAPSAAQAFPILAKPANDVRAGRRVLRHAHEFSEASGTGYVLETHNGDTLCVDSYPPPGLLPQSPDAHASACGSTALAEQRGILESVYWDALPNQYRFVALVPVGGSVDLTIDGTTTPIPVTGDGIATGVVNQDATVALHVGETTTTEPLGPNAGLQGNQTSVAVGSTTHSSATSTTP